MRVLYVDDDPTMTAAVEQMLDSEGYECDSVDLGKRAVELAKRKRYDVILLDIMLPDIDGYEVVERLRTGGVRTPILIQSGLVNRDNDIDGLWLGTSEYLIKPFNKAELIGRIQAVLSRPANTALSDPVYVPESGVPTEDGEGRQRRHRRFETVQPGRILHGRGIDCVILDMSYGGAAIQLPDPDIDCPAAFDLELQSGSTLRCQVRWRSGDRIGVQGETQWPEEVLASLLNQVNEPAAAALAAGEQQAVVQASSEPEPEQPADDAAQDGPEPEPPSQPQQEDPAPADPPAEVLERPEQDGPEPVQQADAAAQDGPEPEPPSQSQQEDPAPVEPREVPASDWQFLEADLPTEEDLLGENRVFAVDRGSRLVAETCECTKLMVDGYLEATARAQSLRVGPDGRFIGAAKVVVAEIHGHVEGELIVTGKLVIHPTGTVSGNTRYREIVIEGGGRILGEVRRTSQGPVEVPQDEQEPNRAAPAA
jgi:DNA-binding response OmpR family regulator/cytoskeletal protein CcmA (bactofilin family)